MPGRHILAIGALLAAAGVALGAFGAHGLTTRLESLGYADEVELRTEWYETGVRYQLYHAMGLVLLGSLSSQATALRNARAAAFGFLLGICLFCGSLYGMTFAPPEWRKLGAIVPLGGLAFLFGWVAIAYGAWRSGFK